MKSPEVCILKTDGINCDMEMGVAFGNAGAQPELVHVNQLRDGSKTLAQYQVLAIPGGFSYGDDIASGKVLATELTSSLAYELHEFTNQKKPIIGVCNGFQVLVRSGLLPDRSIGVQTATLARNDIGRFECRWIDLTVGRSACKFISPEDLEMEAIPIQTAHGEGKFIVQPDNLDKMLADGQVVFRYSKPDGTPAEGYPENPNGSMENIAGICDDSGTILGMMPHPERSIAAFHPHRIRTEHARSAASILFRNIVNYAKEM